MKQNKLNINLRDIIFFKQLDYNLFQLYLNCCFQRFVFEMKGVEFGLVA